MDNADFKVVAIQRCPHRIARVTFEEGGEAAKADFQDQGSIHIRGVECEVISPAPPVEKVLVYHYPYENDDSQVRKVLSRFGSIEDVSYQLWTNLRGVHTGTRIVRMVRTTLIPRSLMIDGFRCKIWHRGQPVKCDACGVEGHVGAKCPKKGICFNCQKPGHVSRRCPEGYGRGAWGLPPNGVSPVSEPGEVVGGGSPAIEAHRAEPVSAMGVCPSGQSPSSAAPPSSGGGSAPNGGVAPVWIPDSEPSLSVCEESSAASRVLDNEGYIMNNEDNAVGNVNDIDNASSKVSNSSNVSFGNASSNVIDRAVGTVSSASNAVNVIKLDNVACSAKTSAGNDVACEPKSCSSADLSSNVSPALGEPVPDASVEVSPSSSVDTEMVAASNHRKQSAPEPPLEDLAAPPGFASGSTSSEPGKSKVSKKAPRPPGCHSLPASVSLATRTASSRGPLS